MGFRDVGAIMISGSAIGFDNLTVCYDRHPAVHHLSGNFLEGSMTGIMGPNGAGKSTLLQAIMGMIPVQQGRILHRFSKKEIAYLPQQAEIDRSFPISVSDTVLLGQWQSAGPFRKIPPEGHTAAFEALEAVGLGGFGKRSVQSLSAGQFQRVLFARVMLQDSKVILLDEPFTAIDARTTADLLAILHRWNREERTVIGVFHDVEQVRENFPETLLLARECIGWGRTSDVLTAPLLKQARVMSESWLEDAGFCARN